MTPEEFRVAGHALIDWIADHRSAVADLPVRAAVAPGEVRDQLPAAPPTVPASFDALLADLDRVVVPGMTHVQHPMYFGWFPANASLASVLGDIASSGLGGLGISWESCPALTEVEEVVCDWMRQLTGLGEQWRGTITDTASTGSFTALLVARERASDLSQNTTGLVGLDRPLVVYTTAQAHSSVSKAALLAGFGHDHLRVVATDDNFAMDPTSLREAIVADVTAGRIPAAVVATVGSTGVTAIDPIEAIVSVASEYGAWVHVDAAMAGSAMLVEECRWMWEGVEGADSISWNPHKWMGTILDCSLLYVRDVSILTRVMSTNPSYLIGGDDGEGVTQYRDWGIPLGRRFRALKLWFHLRIDGIEAIRSRIRADLADAQWLAAQVEAAAAWEVVAPVNLQTVVVRHTPSGRDPAPSGPDIDEHTRAWVDRINRSGEAFLTPSKLADGRWVARISIGAESTGRQQVSEMWQLVRRHAER